MSSWIKELPPLEEDKKNGWRPYPIFNGSTHCLDELSSHMSILSPGFTPHEPHSHAEEELLIMLSGEADIIRQDKKISRIESREIIRPGSLVYYPAFQPHTIKNVSKKPATYLMFKWQSQEIPKKNHMQTKIFCYDKERKNDRIESVNKISQIQIFENPTRYLDKLHCHITTLQPGAGYPPHADSYDVAILLLEGTIETLSRQVNSQAVIFYAAGEPHGMKNIGDIPASYLVFEFHNKAKEQELLQKTKIKSKKTDKTLSICIFSHSAQLGGSERSLLELVTELIKDYGVICYVVLPREGPLKQNLEEIKASVFILDYSWWCDTISLPQDHINNKIQKSFRNVLRFTREILDPLNLDIILTNTITVPWGAIAAYILDKPHIWYIREFGVLDHGLKFFQAFNNVLDFIRNSSNIILTNSQNVRKVLFGEGDNKNISIIPTYIKIPESLTQDKNNYFSRKDSIKLAISGMISESKGQLDAILAVKELIRRKRTVELIIFGEAKQDYFEQLKKIVEDENLTSSIRFLGFKENPYGIISQADIILICSRNEAFGRTTLESMLLKKVVIGTNTGGTPELIKEKFNGLLYTPKNFMELAEKIEYFINNPEKIEELGENGYNFAKNKFTKKEYGGKVHKLLYELKNAKNPHTLLYSILMKELTDELIDEKYQRQQLINENKVISKELNYEKDRYQQLINENKQISEELKKVKSELKNSITLRFARKIPFGEHLRKFLGQKT